MNAENLRERLLKAAGHLEWPTAVVPDFVAPRFRGREDDSTTPLPTGAYGLRLGAYPAIVAPVVLGTVDDMQRTLRTLHSQMVIARSYMRPEEVINAHLFLCAVNPTGQGDWRSVIDLAERDEAVCRKIVWLPEPSDLDASFASFRARTFLASPWTLTDERRDAALDSNQGLAQRTLESHGLSAADAAAWIDIVDRLREDPDTMVSELVGTRV